MPPRFVLPPRPQLVDEPPEWRLEGCDPGAPVEVHATVDVSGQQLHSSAVFVADADGSIDVASQPSLRGTYVGADAFGLLWSGTPAGSTERPPLDPVAVTLDALGESARLERLWLAPQASATPVHDGGVTGLYCRPAGDGPFPAVVVFGGSGGGLGPAAAWAPLLASRGFATLAIAYFAAPGLPEALVNIEVECVERARDWLLGRAEVRRGPIAMMGQSRGSELALLAASALAGIGAIVVFSGSTVVWSGLDASGPVDEPAWTLRGAAVPYVAPRPDLVWSNALTPIFRAHLQDHAAVERAAIPVEDIEAPILAVSGLDDAMWPSADLVELGASRARSLTHLCYADAGHTAPGIPGTPAAVETLHPVTGEHYVFGGSLQGCAAARADSWPRVVAFLRESLV